MSLLKKLFAPRYEVHAHCDLFCGVYDPAQAMIEAHSCLKSAEKYHASDDDVFRARAVAIKEERAELVKHHLWVLWTDFFEPKHVEDFPELHEGQRVVGEYRFLAKIALVQSHAAAVSQVDSRNDFHAKILRKAGIGLSWRWTADATPFQ